MHIFYFFFILLLSFPVCAGGDEPLPSFGIPEFALPQEKDEWPEEVDTLLPLPSFAPSELVPPQEKDEWPEEDDELLPSFAPLPLASLVSPQTGNIRMFLTESLAEVFPDKGDVDQADLTIPGFIYHLKKEQIKDVLESIKRGDPARDFLVDVNGYLRAAVKPPTSISALAKFAASVRTAFGLRHGNAARAMQKKLSYVPLTESLAEAFPDKMGVDITKLTIPRFVYHLKKAELKSVLDGIKNRRKGVDILANVNGYLSAAEKATTSKPALGKFAASVRKACGLGHGNATGAKQKRLSYTPLTESLAEAFPGKMGVDIMKLTIPRFVYSLNKDALKSVLEDIKAGRKAVDILEDVNGYLRAADKPLTSAPTLSRFTSSVRTAFGLRHGGSKRRNQGVGTPSKRVKPTT